MKRLVAYLAAFSSIIFVASPSALATAQPDADARVKSLHLNEIAIKTVENHFLPDGKRKTLTQLTKEFSQGNVAGEPRGLFVTLSKDGKTRACWGSITPEHADLITSTVYTTEAALNKEYRFAQVKRGEIGKLKAQVTVIKSVDPIDSIREINPLRHGLFVRQGGRAAVLLPGECVDAHYQLVQCKLKAGIPVNSRCQMYRITADVFHN
jgi:AMMECR1 domain-containing protein